MGDIMKMERDTAGSMKPYGFSVKKPEEPFEIILYDFQKPKTSTFFKTTEYIVYDCTVLKIGEKKPPIMPPHAIELPRKASWFRLFHFLKAHKALKKKNLKLRIRKVNNYVFNFEFIDR